MAFDAIYFWEKKNIKKNFFIILKAIIIITLVGLPFIAIKIIYLWYINRNIWDTWEKISPYKNIKIVIIRKRKMIKNMKKLLSMAGKEVVSNVENRSAIGMYKIDKGEHGVGISNESLIGFTQSSKKLTEKDLKLSLKEEKDNYTYTQIWKNPIKITRTINEIKNPSLKKILEDESAYHIIMANKKIAETKEEFVKINDNGKQKWVSINSALKSKAKKEIELIGKEKNIETFIKEYGVFKFYEENVQKVEQMIFELSNANKEKYNEIRFKYEKNYIALLLLKEKLALSPFALEKIEILLEKINKFI